MLRRCDEWFAVKKPSTGEIIATSVNQVVPLKFHGPTKMLYYRSLAKKGPWAVHITLCSDRGWVDICNIAAFTNKKVPCLHYHNLQQDIAHQHLPSTSLIQFSVCISQACVASHKWTSGSVLLTFQEKDSKLQAMTTGKPSHVEKLRIFSAQ